MKDIQEFMKIYHSVMNWQINTETYEKSRESLLNNYLLLTTEVAEVAEELRKSFNLTQQKILDGTDKEAAFAEVKASVKEDIGNELADCLAYLIKFYNFFDIDLEESFYTKMAAVKARKNKDL
jgi:NTP pyrophosphatase (non-canonical NTP hydrolase)